MSLGNIIFLLTLILIVGYHQPINPTPQKTANSSLVDQKVNSQEKINLLLSKIKSADTILLVSHTGSLFDPAKKDEIFPVLIVNNKINKKIIREQKILESKNIGTLVQILLMPTSDADFAGAKCCDPHHTIFIIRNGQISYIDLCFQCFCLTTSKDLELIKGYNEPKWIALLSFFRKLGFQYEMPVK